MLSHAKKRFKNFEAKVTFVQSNLRNQGWTQTLEGTYDAVVSSFVTHTIPDNIKALYQELFKIVSPGGCFLACDVFPPPGPDLEEVYRKYRILEFQHQIKLKTGVEKSLQEVEQLLHERRQNYKAFFSDSDKILAVGTPTVINHLEWLKAAGFDEVDCLWKHTRTAIIGGFRHHNLLE